MTARPREIAVQVRYGFALGYVPPPRRGAIGGLAAFRGGYWRRWRGVWLVGVHVPRGQFDA